jgi:hypothetical protein
VVDNYCLIISMLQILAQNSLVILESWSETMDIGIPNMHSICSKKSLAKSPVEVLVWVGINWAALVLWHTIIKIELSFLPVLLQ